MKSNTLSSDIKRALTGRGFWIGIAGIVLVIILSSLENVISLTRSNMPMENGYHAEFIKNALSSDWVTLALPIVCTLPFTTAFVDDIKSGFIKQYLHRSGIKEYIKGKLVACCLSGGLVLFIGILLAYGLSALVFSPMELALRAGRTAQPYFAQMLMVAATLFLSGAFWSLLGFTCAALTMSKYMAYASPFVLYYVLIILHERYFTSLYVLYPKEWLFPSDAWVLGGLGVILLLAELIAAVCLAFIITAKRRLAHV
ncbi:MAG: hypothetical protein ACYCX2_00440 [Christensenellales bacterium]